jgi:hypothetical protein
LARADQLVLLVDFPQLVCRSGAVPLTLSQLDVGIIDVVVKPRLVEAVFCHLKKGELLLRRTALLADNTRFAGTGFVSSRLVVRPPTF